MKLSAKYWGGGLLVVGVIVALLGSTMVFADGINPGVLAIDGQVGGLTYGQWSAKWWQRAFSLPDNFTDCTENQPTGQVWFLDGTTGGSATRNCTVPAGKNIMFPILNAEQSVVEAESTNTGNLPNSTCPVPGVNGKLITGTDYTALSSCAKALVQYGFHPNSTLEADIDGMTLKDVGNYRAASPPPLFNFTAVKGNPFAAICKANAGPRHCPLTSSAAADGVWIILENPLSAGMHTIHFKADVPDLGFTTETTYNLTVQ